MQDFTPITEAGAMIRMEEAVVSEATVAQVREGLGAITWSVLRFGYFVAGGRAFSREEARSFALRAAEAF